MVANTGKVGARRAQDVVAYVYPFNFSLLDELLGGW